MNEAPTKNCRGLINQTRENYSCEPFWVLEFLFIQLAKDDTGFWILDEGQLKKIPPKREIFMKECLCSISLYQ